MFTIGRLRDCLLMSTTSENNKRIAKNTLFLYLRMLLVMGVTLYTSRIILNTLGVEDYGIYNVVGGLASSFVFFSSSLSNATQRFLNVELGKNNLENVMWMRNHSEWNKSEISILKMKRTKKNWNEISFEKQKTENKWNDINWIVVYWMNWMIVICDAHWKFHCVYHETEMFSKRMKKTKRNESTFHSYITQYLYNFVS